MVEPPQILNRSDCFDREGDERGKMETKKHTARGKTCNDTVRMWHKFVADLISHISARIISNNGHKEGEGE